MLAQPVLPLGAFGIFENLAKRGLADIKISVPFEVTSVHFLVCNTCHEIASCCRERIMLASRVVICERMSTGIVSSMPGRGHVACSTLPAHSAQACIQAFIPRRRKSARPKPSPL